MAANVRRRRSSNGTGGQARTRLARAAVAGAARTLFLERGYAATTIEAISDLSDVPPATVYRLFSSKLGILKALLDVSIAGDDVAVALEDRPHVRALLADSDPRSQLSGFAGITRGIMSRTEALYRILVSAAGSDPDAAALLAAQTRHRQQGQAGIARSLARAGALRPKLRERDAADIIHALMSPEIYRLLVADRGWPPERYERWLREILIDQLLPPPATGGGPPRTPERHTRLPMEQKWVRREREPAPAARCNPYIKPTRKDTGMETRTESSAISSRYRPVRWRSVGYWLATAVVAGELALGGIWDIARISFVADLVRHLGYPSYFLVLLGSWKVLAAVALLIPRRALLKEWAYAGAFFTYTGAIVSHLVTGYDLAEVGLLAALTILTVLSWALRPPSRRTSPCVSAAPLAAASPRVGRPSAP